MGRSIRLLVFGFHSTFGVWKTGENNRPNKVFSSQHFIKFGQTTEVERGAYGVSLDISGHSVKKRSSWSWRVWKWANPFFSYRVSFSVPEQQALLFTLLPSTLPATRGFVQCSVSFCFQPTIETSATAKGTDGVVLCVATENIFHTVNRAVWAAASRQPWIMTLVSTIINLRNTSIKRSL